VGSLLVALFVLWYFALGGKDFLYERAGLATPTPRVTPVVSAPANKTP
jgi:hypothetical protein